MCRIAHESEIVHRTGLGDVAAARQAAGLQKGPGIGAEIIRLCIEEPVFAVNFSSLYSPSCSVTGTSQAGNSSIPGGRRQQSHEFFSFSRSFCGEKRAFNP